MTDETRPQGFAVTQLGRHAWSEDDKVVELISDGTPVVVQIPTPLALDLAVALLQPPPGAPSDVGYKVDQLDITMTDKGEILLMFGLKGARLPLILPASAAEALRLALSGNPLQGDLGSVN